MDNINHEKIQSEIKHYLKNILQRTSGLVPKRDAENVFGEGAKLILRLFTKFDDDTLQWKNEIVSTDILLRKLGDSYLRKSEACNLLLSTKSNNSSRYEYLAYANKESLIGFSFDQPIFGLDIFVKPVVEFSKTGEFNNNFEIGRNSLAFFIHVDDSSSFMLRANMGESIMNYGINSYIDAEIKVQRKIIEEYFYGQDYSLLAETLCNAANTGIKKWVFSGV